MSSVWWGFLERKPPFSLGSIIGLLQCKPSRIIDLLTNLEFYDIETGAVQNENCYQGVGCERSVEMLDLEQFKLQFITDENGEKTAVILPIDEFQELVEDLEDLAIVAERRDQPTISHQELLAELEQD